MDCKYKDQCSGCALLGVPLAEQQQMKKMQLQNLLSQAQIPLNTSVGLVSPGAAGLRDRVDFVLEQGRFGLYERNSRQILDLDLCPQLSPAAQDWLNEFRQFQFPIQKGSVRLRVGPQGQRGLWLDFANVDIKNLLDEKNLLQSLQQKTFVEIGQRRKVPVLIDGHYKLRDPQPKVWFQTWMKDQAVDLYCSVASFTQPSLRANRDLVQVIESWLDQSGAQNVLEFGSGIGNLSFPALGHRRNLTACEIDEGALSGFALSLDALSQKPGFENCQDRVKILRGDFQNKNPQDFEKYDVVLANPPRSGLKRFLQPLIDVAHKPKYFIYMSCYPESFVEDGKQLLAAGYQIMEIKIVDQFPQTHHYEILSLWEFR